MAFIDPLRRVQRLRRADPKRPADPAPPIPPGQYQTKKFPVLTFGETPVIQLENWQLRIWGQIENPIELDWAVFRKLPRAKIHTDIHCVTRWSLLDTTWEGVAFRTIVEMARPLPTAVAVMQHAYGGYTTNLRLEDLLAEDVLLADTFNGEPLSPEHGGPLRMVVPHLYFWKSAKWLRALEFLSEDKPGFWERYGYHMHGDPWAEERFG